MHHANSKLCTNKCAGGIFFPLAKALCLACGSDPAKGTEKKMGAYVMKTLFQTSCISSAMFITAMAANPLAVNLASEALGQPITWGAWALAGIVPGLICLTAAPLILYVLYPPGMLGLCQHMCCCMQRMELYMARICKSLCAFIQRFMPGISSHIRRRLQPSHDSCSDACLMCMRPLVKCALSS